MHLILSPCPDYKPPRGVRLRILGKEDIGLLVEHLTGLDARGRRDRFNGATDTTWIEDYARRCIHPGVMVLAAEHDGHVIGVAEMHPVKLDSAEVAFSVDAKWRGRGVGAALFALILEAAWSRGLDEIEITTHSGNDAMKALARKFGAQIRFDSGDTVGKIRLDDIHMLDVEQTD